jgi:hypothetical protein
MPWPDPDVFLADVQRAVGLVPPPGDDTAGGRMGR